MILALLSFLLPLLSFPAYGEGETARTNLLRTSNNPDYFAILEANGNTISARGKIAGDRVRKMYFYKNEDITSSYSMNVSEDGAFTAELTAVTGKDEELLILKLTSGAALTYLMRYDGGWYFPVNGLEKENRLVLNDIYNSPDTVSRVYLSDKNDDGEIATAREQIKLLAEQVTDGIESDYEKAKALSLFVAETIYYDMDVRNGHGDVAEAVALCNVLKTCRTICSGFANLYCALLEAVGIDAVTVIGGVTTDDLPYDELKTLPHNHEFTAFYYKEQSRWVWVDSCWNGSGNYENGTYKKGKPKLLYFDITDEALSLNHRADRAERRRYFPTDKPDETEAPVITDAESGTTAENDAPEAETTETAVTTAPPETTFTFTTPKAEIPEDISPSDDIIYIVIVSALAMAIAAVSAVIIRIFLNIKRKDSALAQGYRDMVIIELENGKKIKLELYPEIAPETVANFEKLVNKGFYDGLTFHRVISGFMIQGGCPLGNGTGNSGEHIKGEFLANGFPNELKHTRGVISMARAADPNSASCQFFIMHEDAPHLDGSYAAFGKVIEGMDAVDEIASCETDYADKPVTPVVMKSVKIVE